MTTFFHYPSRLFHIHYRLAIKLRTSVDTPAYSYQWKIAVYLSSPMQRRKRRQPRFARKMRAEQASCLVFLCLLSLRFSSVGGLMELSVPPKTEMLSVESSFPSKRSKASGNLSILTLPHNAFDVLMPA